VRGRAALAAAFVLALPLPQAAARSKEEKRLEECRNVLDEITTMPEGLSRELLDRAYCVAVIPSVKKFAIGVGARWGKGAAVCRTDEGRGSWGAPLMISTGGGGLGLQIGGQAIDLLLVVMNKRGMERLLGSKFTLGGDVAVAAGPKGRASEAATDISMRAEILAYARSRGLFAGLSIDGTVVNRDDGANRKLYGRKLDPRELLLDPKAKLPEAGRPLVELLRELSPKLRAGS
jgi:lipid-binding SYLF domain-containing protein